MIYLAYYLWLGVTGFWDLLTFQSLTANAPIDFVFSIAVYLNIFLIVIMTIKPKRPAFGSAFVIDLAALLAIIYLFVTRSGKSGLAEAGYLTALIQLLIVFVVLLVITLLVFACAPSRNKKGADNVAECQEHDTENKPNEP